MIMRQTKQKNTYTHNKINVVVTPETGLNVLNWSFLSHYSQVVSQIHYNRLISDQGRP